MLACCASAVFAAQPAEQPGLTVGLVLGGGGARGAAHIGVIEELERMRVPIHAIVGTSMGAVVGGLYASGVSSAELKELVATLDWKDALSDSASREDWSYRRKQDDEDFPVRFELGLRGTDLRLPRGVLQGQQLDLLLRRLTLQSANIRDFDGLAIPFRAVASDLVSGEEYVIGEGDLALAIRASMAVPGAFAPVPVGDALLVDGGLVGNLGIETMRGMGVDVIIAVDVEFPLYQKDRLDSATGIAEQVLTIMIRRETMRQIALLDENDILIRPELGEFASTAFAESSSAIGPGSAAVREHAAELSQYALDPESYLAWRAARRVSPPEAGAIEFVRVERDGRVSPDLARRVDVAPGDPVDADSLARSAGRLYGLQVFEKVGYRLVEENGELGVVYSATTKPWGPGFLRFGLAIEDDFEGTTAFNIGSRWWRPVGSRLGAEWRTDLAVGTSPAIATEFYQPLGRQSRLFIAPSARLGQRNFNAFLADAPVAELRLTEGSLGIDAGLELGTVGEFRLGAYRGFSNARIKVGPPDSPDLDLATGGLRAALRIDTRDSARFPRSGLQAELAWDSSQPALGADLSYETASLDVDTTWSRGKSTLSLGLQAGSALGTASAVQDHFTLGGFLRLSGLEIGQLTGPYAGLGRLVYYRRIGSSAGSLFEVPVYAGASLETGNTWAQRSDVSLGDLSTNGSLFLGLDSYIGPIYLAVGFAEGGRTNFYLFIGATPR